MKKIKLIVIIPVGPTTSTEFLSDTIESIKYYCSKSHKIILVNDSQRDLDSSLWKYEIDEVKTPRSMGKQSGLFFSLCMGIEHARKHYDFEVLLRMDDDALICGKTPEVDAIHYFEKNPKVGMLGSYRTTWDGSDRDFGPPKKQIQIETSFLWKVMKFIKRRKSNDIKDIVHRAQQNGYEFGEHVLGGVYFMSRKLIDQLYKDHLISSSDFYGSRLEEDHIFGILTYAVDMRLGDFVTGNYPMCLKWKGMPTSPETIYQLGKKVIHSTRYYEDMKEREVRKKLKALRQK